MELYRDRPPEQWPLDADGDLAMGNEPIDFDDLLAEPVPGEGSASASP